MTSCAVLVALYCFSLFGQVRWYTENNLWTISQGAVSYSWNRPHKWEWPDRWPMVYSDDAPPRWWFLTSVGHSTTQWVPLWVPLLFAALPTAYAWWRCRRFPPGHCQKCGYDLTGNTTGVCPECGQPAEPKGAAP